MRGLFYVSEASPARLCQIVLPTLVAAQSMPPGWLMASTHGKKAVEWRILMVHRPPSLLNPATRCSPYPDSYSCSFSSGYNRAESLADYKSGEEFIFMLVDLVSRGGNLLLNVGPSGAGFRQKPQSGNDNALTHCARRRWHNSGDNAAAPG